MKKISSYCLILAFLGIVKPQQSISQIIRPETNIAGLMSYESIPANLDTGIPSINVPVFSIPTRSKAVTMNIGIGYHPSNAIYYSEVGDAGDFAKGWSLFEGGVISRTIVGAPDETEFVKPIPDPVELLKSDLYQFNFMGYSGRFTVSKETNGTLKGYVKNGASRLCLLHNFKYKNFLVRKIQFSYF